MCSLLAFYTQDSGQIDSIFRSSGLYRDKWERADYRDRTIDIALQGVKETYNPENKRKGKSGKEKPEKIIVYFDEVADQILKDNHIFSMRDNGQIYLYKNGVYRTEGIEAILGTKIRDVHLSLFKEKRKDRTQIRFARTHTESNCKYVNEVLEYIRSYTHRSRKKLTTTG